MIGPAASVIIDRISNGTLHALIVNLHQLDQGYSVVFPASDGRKWTTRCFSYEDECELLDDIEHNRLPLFLIDLIDRYCCTSTESVYYQGCIGVEIRDFRRGSTSQRSGSLEDRKYDVSYTVLRPTSATLLNDLENLHYALLCMEKSKDSETSKQRPSATESAESLFDRRAQFDDQRLTLEADFWKMVTAKRCLRNDSNSTSNTVQWPYKKQLRYDIRARRRREARFCLEQHFPITYWIVNNVIPKQHGAAVNLRFEDHQSTISTAPASQWKPMIPTMVKTPLEIAEKRFQRAQLQQDQQQSEFMDGMELVEEYGIELPSGKQKTMTRIRIYRRCLDSVYVGHLRMEREDCPADGGEEQSNWTDAISECSFLLGSESGSRSYIRQYLDMVSEGGRRPLTLTRRVPGKPPQVMPQAARGLDSNGITATACSIPPPPIVIPIQASGNFVGQSQQHMQYIAGRSARSTSQDFSDHPNGYQVINTSQNQHGTFSLG